MRVHGRGLCSIPDFELLVDVLEMLPHRRGADAGSTCDLFVRLAGSGTGRDGEVVGEIEVVDAVRYRASLSRMAWFSFMNRSSLFWNARSERFASTCSVIA